MLERTITDDFSAKENIEIVSREFDGIVSKAISIDTSTEKYILAERQKTINALENIEKKMLQAIKRKMKILYMFVSKLQTKFFLIIIHKSANSHLLRFI